MKTPNLRILTGRMALTLTALGMLLTGCSGEATDGEPDPGVVEVELTVGLTDLWEVTGDGDDASRAAPPGGGQGTGIIMPSEGGEADTAVVDRVDIFVFRRAEGSSESFVFDPENYQECRPLNTMVRWDEGDDYYEMFHTHKAYRGKLRKRMGYEYRLIAIAHQSDCHSPFDTGNFSDFHQAVSFNHAAGLKYEDFEITVNKESGAGTHQNMFATSGLYGSSKITGDFTSVPQFFYGQGHSQYHRGDPIIRYADTDDKGKSSSNLMVHAICYRAVAKIEIKMPIAAYHYGINYSLDYVSLLCDNVGYKANLAEYSGFDRPSAYWKGKYTAISMLKAPATGSTQTITAWVLPGVMRLGIRGQFSVSAIERHTVEGQIAAENQVVDGTATGVINPIVYNNRFFVEKNHRYLLEFGSNQDTNSIFTDSGSGDDHELIVD